MSVNSRPLGHRQRQAQATREQIARAARTLFRERGYVSTTVAAIAEAAAIPVQTIYSAFGTKANILKEITQEWMSESQTAQIAADTLANCDAADRLRLFARLQRHQLEVGDDVISIYQEAARADPEMAIVMTQVWASREREIQKLVESLDGHLAPGLTSEEALDRFLACTVPEVYRSLVLGRGWCHDRYESWLAELLITQLLDGRADGASRESRPSHPV